MIQSGSWLVMQVFFDLPALIGETAGADTSTSVRTGKWVVLRLRYFRSPHVWREIAILLFRWSFLASMGGRLSKGEVFPLWMQRIFRRMYLLDSFPPFPLLNTIIKSLQYQFIRHNNNARPGPCRPAEAGHQVCGC
jgi:hypothetical protein